MRVASSSPEVDVIQGSTGPAAVAVWRKRDSVTFAAILAPLMRRAQAGFNSLRLEHD
jgi:hypothetical protein